MMSVNGRTASPLARAIGVVMLGVGCLTLGACANTRADNAVAAQSSLVGLSRSDLLTCAGAPTRVITDGTSEFLTYVSRSFDSRSRTSIGFGIGGGSHSLGYGVGFNAPLVTNDIDSRVCEATFRVENGRVTNINYVGTARSTSARLSECFSIVESCLATAATSGTAQGAVFKRNGTAALPG